MKKILLFLFMLCGFISQAQVYNNEWIQYNKTYYKFKLGKTGVHRIPASVLSTSGLSNIPAEQFQLWRHGVQVPIYTSSSTGTLPSNGYIEFWGEENDGKADSELYRNPDFQLNDKFSLSSDSSVYFLTINTIVANNLRLEESPNNVAANTLPAEPWFMYTRGFYFKDRINNGYAVNVGEYLYSSSYDKGEGYASNDIVSNATPTGLSVGKNTTTLSNLFVSSTGPSPSFVLHVSGNMVNPRAYKVFLNNDSIMGNQVDFFNYAKDTATFPLGLISSSTANVVIENHASIVCFPPPQQGCQLDRMVVHKYEINYPRQFNFGGSSNFEFSLPATAQGYFLQIQNFNYGSSVPVLYDLTEGKRYLADLSAAPLLKFVLPPFASDRKLVLVSEEASNINTVSALITRNFVDYTQPAMAGDFLIITNQALFGTGVNPVEEYRAYRSSSVGGGHNAKIYLADEIVDQFGFGIHKFAGAIRNFIRYARLNYPVTPKYVFIIGHGVHYLHQRTLVTPDMDKLNLVPSFGWPASDILLTAEPGSSVPNIPIGRLSVINAEEVAVYLSKVKEYEQTQTTSSPLIADKDWMKNVVHIIGASDNILTTILAANMNNYKNIIQDTLFGGKVSTFTKNSSDAVQQLNNGTLVKLFSDGISLITYFGHSSASTLEFNLENPQNYNNQGKYPLFVGLGCNAGNFFSFNGVRFITKETISEKYVLAPNRGTIGFIASSHFGLVHYLDIWNSYFYKRLARSNYGRSIGEAMLGTIQDVYNFTGQEDFYSRSNAEETQLHGDPSIVLNSHAKPDYAIEEPMVKMSPSFVSVADGSFRLDAKTINLGRAPSTPVVMEVKRQYPDGTTAVILRDSMIVKYADSIIFDVPIDPIKDKGLNKITVTIDADNIADELYETNNTITREVMIYEDEARPVFPYNYAIINTPTVILKASTANPFSSMKQYTMEMDTTEFFNSPAKISQTISSVGGLITFNPGINLNSGTVYYWRVGTMPATGPMTWNSASFIYIAGSDRGFSQSHFYQHKKSSLESMTYDSARHWNFGNSTGDLFIRNGVFPTAASFSVDFSVAINGDPYVRSVCGLSNIIFNVIDPVTFKPWINGLVGQQAKYGSDPICGNDRRYNFQYNIMDTAKRRAALEFLDMIPPGHFVIARNTSGTDPLSNTYASTWANDTTYFGSGNSMYHRLKGEGFLDIDSFYMPRAFAFVYQKGNQTTFTPKWSFSQGLYDKITVFTTCETKDTIGFIKSPLFGPAIEWKQLLWNGTTVDTTGGDHPLITILGTRADGVQDTVMTDITLGMNAVDIWGIPAQQYPYLQILMRNADSVNYTPYQLDYWRLTYEPAPEGAVAPNIYFSMPDTVDVAEPLQFRMAFKNISEAPFSDSVKIKVSVTDRQNVTHVLPPFFHRPLPVEDTILVSYPLDTKLFSGLNSLYVEVNPDNHQPEQYHFNNTFFRQFYVRPDTLNPLLDVTFDNVRILNHDIVSASPDIMIKLKDESKWFMLQDTSRVSVKVRFPDNTLKDYYFNGTDLIYLGPGQAPNTDNTATVNLKPKFTQDGTYELIVTGKDMSENRAGALEYRVAFQVYNKPMISNMLNYPNPFTTSTAFVFTITGSEVPQNIRIQILTVTGKVVREITKDELGPLHIGRNITEFKWDGTDQYGQKLGNGVYLYRVVTNLNGKSLDKFENGDNTDRFFNKGYGKMYLMR